MKRKPRFRYYVVRVLLQITMGLSAVMSVLFFVSAARYESPLMLVFHMLCCFIWVVIAVTLSKFDKDLEGWVR